MELNSKLSNGRNIVSGKQIEEGCRHKGNFSYYIKNWLHLGTDRKGGSKPLTNCRGRLSIASKQGQK